MESGLREHLATAQRIVRVAQLARRHELPGEGAPAEGDQQLQTTAALETVGEQAAAGQAAAGSGSTTPADDGSGSQPGRVDELGLEEGSAGQRLVEAFMQRMGSAALDCAALGQERLRLAAENGTLRAVVAAVRGGASLGPATVDDPLNTLLVVNARLQKGLGGAALARRALAGAPSPGRV